MQLTIATHRSEANWTADGRRHPKSPDDCLKQSITLKNGTSGILKPTVRVAIDSLRETLPIIQIASASNDTMSTDGGKVSYQITL